MKKLILFTMLACSLFVNRTYAQSYPNPNFDSAQVLSGANTSGLALQANCNQPGMKTLTVAVFASGSATVTLQAGPALGYYPFTIYTLLSAASGVAIYNAEVAFPFWNISSTTPGVTLRFMYGCK